ncbi:FAD-binding dehydrogenase [Mycobacterium sp. MS1601]|uniref:FAD-binding dehydrogenase n=1 Tax=Mycobacterium sp. MS1601 TaxID=1936029 RepID=UPI0009797DB8|nr:FAD-binding dehydrogenase [Mycobacterium sp. MS1601]AQA04698.1 FAD-binding dehydrogenase [Mycobacterium sp. MS1601]
MDADAIVVGAGLAGLIATHELTRQGKKVAVLDQENRGNLGGQAFWSGGGLFLVNSPEQRRLGIKDSVELAWSDWCGSASFDRLDGEDQWAAQWARCYVEFAAGEKRSWLREHGVKLLPVVGWAERGDLRADGHGNSVPRFHLTWGAGNGVLEPFVNSALDAAARGLVTFHHRHRVDELALSAGAVCGVRGAVLAPDDSRRGEPSNRDILRQFDFSARCVILTTGGIGGNPTSVRQHWSPRMGVAPRSMITGAPAYVDGRMLDIVAALGVRVVNRDRMWHYAEGVQNWDPVWRGHAIRVLAGPSSMWFDALGRRLPQPFLPGYDNLGTLRYLRTTPEIAEFDHSWFIQTQKAVAREFALSGSDQNPDIANRSLTAFARERLLRRGAPTPVEAFKKHGADFIVADTLEDLVARMNGLTERPLLDVRAMRSQIEARDRQMANPYSKDSQVQGYWNARRFIADRIGRTAAPHRILDPTAGPLIATKLHVMTRKTLGGIQTDLSSRALGHDGTPVEGLFAAGEAAGFGGGGVHGYNALEGTFLGGCVYSGRIAGRAAADAL